MCKRSVLDMFGKQRVIALAAPDSAELVDGIMTNYWTFIDLDYENKCNIKVVYSLEALCTKTWKHRAFAH